MVSDAMARDGVEIHLNSTVTSVRLEGGKKVIELLSDGNTATTCVDEILTGIGRVPAVQGLNLEAAGVAYDAQAGIHVDDFLRTSNPRIFAAGDVCLEHRFTNTAAASARIVVRNALFLGRQRMSALTVPWCTYTDPEIAHVGLYVKQARQQRIPVKTFTIPMHDVDRAITDSEEDGFVKIHVREGSDKILGATIVARHAGEMINSISLAMVAGIGLRALAQVVACDIHPLNNLRVMQFLERDFSSPQVERQRWTQHWIIEGFRALESMLDDNASTGLYCDGDAPTLADLCLIPQVYNARRFDVDMAAFPVISRIEQQCLILPAFDAARPENQPDAPKRAG